MRRRSILLHVAQLGGLGSLLSGCGAGGLEALIHPLTDPLNRRVEGWLFDPERLAAEPPASAIRPSDLLVNDIAFNSGRPGPQLDPVAYRLEVTGLVAKPQTLTLAEIRAMPARTVTMRHVCVEGWAAIVRWTGLPLRALAERVQPLPAARYVYFFSADNYYESWDLASATHPQTLLAYGMNDGPLPAANGAPLRLASPVKLGYKQSKWVTAIGFTDQLLPQQGYWEDQGYEWFAGL